jgi:hypothetical protein
MIIARVLLTAGSANAATRQMEEAGAAEKAMIVAQAMGITVGHIRIRAPT